MHGSRGHLAAGSRQAMCAREACMGRRMNEIQDVAGAAGAVHRREQYSKGRRALVGSDWAEGLGAMQIIVRSGWRQGRPARARWHGATPAAVAHRRVTQRPAAPPPVAAQRGRCTAAASRQRVRLPPRRGCRWSGRPPAGCRTRLAGRAPAEERGRGAGSSVGGLQKRHRQAQAGRPSAGAAAAV